MSVIYLIPEKFSDKIIRSEKTRVTAPMGPPGGRIDRKPEIIVEA